MKHGKKISEECAIAPGRIVTGSSAVRTGVIVTLNGFAGWVIRILEAADGNQESLVVEAAVDDVRITRQ